MLEAIIEREQPDAILPTLGGQTALNLALALDRGGVLAKHGVEMLGATLESIRKAEDRSLFKAAMEKIGARRARGPASRTRSTRPGDREGLGFPVDPAARPSRWAARAAASRTTRERVRGEASRAASPSRRRTRSSIEESVLGWKEFELEVIRDRADNFIVVCSIENFDPMGVHTGDSITVAPAMTLTDKEYQRLRDARARS